MQMNPAQFLSQWGQLNDQGLADEQVVDLIIRNRHDCAIPEIPMPANPYQAAGQGIADARKIAFDVRDIDTYDIWVELSKWNPTRVLTLVLTLAAALPEDRSIEDLLDWVHDFNQIEAAS